MPKYRHGVCPNTLMEHSVLYTYDCVKRDAPEDEVLEDVKAIFEKTYKELHEALENCTIEELTTFLMERMDYEKL